MTSSVVKIGGASDGIQHSLDLDEVAQFIVHMNEVLAGDPDCPQPLPLDQELGERASLFEDARDGIRLLKLLKVTLEAKDNNSAKCGGVTVDDRLINKKRPLDAFRATENHNLLLGCARAAGLHTVNIGAGDLRAGRAHLVLGLLWQIIKRGLLAPVNLAFAP